MKRLFGAVVLTMAATVAMAGGPNGGDRGPGGPGGPNGAGGPGADVIVADNGTAYVEKDTTASGATTRTSSLTAISNSGASLWTVNLTNAGHLFLSGSNLINVTSTRATDTTAASSTITALSTASGAVVWTVNVDGNVVSARPVSGGVYAVVVTPAATSGGTATRSLVAISSSGAKLFTVAL